jgi:hypothetical protein
MPQKRSLGIRSLQLLQVSRNDTLFFTGLGDPTFLHPDFPKQPSFEYLAGIKTCRLYTFPVHSMTIVSAPDGPGMIIHIIFLQKDRDSRYSAM